MNRDTTRVLILGGGFGGVKTALELAKIKPPNVKITLVNRTPFHEYHADMYELAAAFLPESSSERQTKLVFENLEGTVSTPLKKIFEGYDVTLVVDELEHINLSKRFVIAKESGILNFDFLVIALGSTTNYFGIPNLESLSLPLKTADDALNIRNEIDELFLHKSREESIRLVIGGGGFTGCELAGELVAYLSKLSSLHNHPVEKIDLTIIEACPTLLNGASSWIQKKALSRLLKLGVQVKLESKITAVEGRYLKLDSGENIEFDLLIWTAGIMANPLISSLDGVQMEKNSCPAIDQNLQILGHPGTFAIGDNSLCYDYSRACVVPSTAQLAIAQGKFVAKSIKELVQGYSKEVFQPRLTTFIVPLGKGYALGNLAGINLEGKAAWWLKRLVALRYFSSILPLSEALKIWFRGVIFFVK